MKIVRSSLKLKITLLFLITFFCIVSMVVFLHFKREYENNIEIKRFIKVAYASAFDKHEKTFDVEEFVSNGFIQITDSEKIKLIMKSVIKEDGHMQGNNMQRKHMQRMGKHSKFNISLSSVDKEMFVIFEAPNESYVFSAKNFKKSNLANLILFELLILLIIFLYLAIMKSIKPLHTLRDKIKEFSDGNNEVDCKIDGNDEIADVANEFDAAVKKINSLRNARQLFLRNIMHELKSPIMRGKLATTMLEEQNPYKEVLDKVFIRQDELLKEFLRIEQLGIGEVKLEKEDFLLQDVIDYSLDILGDSAKNIEVNIDNSKVHVDFELFATAIKNLLDNAVLYSSDKSAKIQIIDNKILISNLGDKLEFSLDRYKEPFFLQGKKQKESRGLGFGLFISIHLLNLHNMDIVYKHDNGMSIFEISLV